jgi:hypothetical protein
MTNRKTAVLVSIVPAIVVGALQVLGADAFVARDPGVRGGPAGVGGPIGGLTTTEGTFFDNGREEFEEAETPPEGLGPRLNLDSCLGCHSQPVSGGTSPALNPQVAFANAFNATNLLPSFITAGGPVREARFRLNPNGTPDGGVHGLFVTTGRTDAPGCNAVQEDFEAQVAAGNISFRIPTPTFGAGLIEMIPDATIEANRTSSQVLKTLFGIAGRANRNGNDGTIARFGWKAQNKSLLLFAGEAYNVEMGISNELFQDERDANPNCNYTTNPNSVTTADETTGAISLSAIEQFGFFMRFLAPPVPSTTLPGNAASITAGRAAFTAAGCAFCHTPSLTSGAAAVTALANKPVNLFSDLLVHHMGPRLADKVSQGQAKGDDFRSAPLWGLGKRIFFLHDGRTKDLIEAIRAHKSGANSEFRASEGNTSVDVFNALSETTKQNLLNFLRSL